MVCWVEPSAQNSIYISNNPSHKKPVELNSYLLWHTQNLCVIMWRLQGLIDPIILWVTWLVFTPYPFTPNGHLLHSFIPDEQKRSLSPKLGAPNSFAQIFVIP